MPTLASSYSISGCAVKGALEDSAKPSNQSDRCVCADGVSAREVSTDGLNSSDCEEFNADSELGFGVFSETASGVLTDFTCFFFSRLTKAFKFGISFSRSRVILWLIG
jgi:hypothetical protein